MNQVAVITDQHIGVRGDNQLFHTYFAKFYRECFFPTLEEHGIDTVLNLGDIFDRRKYINFDTLNRCRDYFFDELAKRNITFTGIVGNHDVMYKNSNHVNAPNLLLQDYANFTFYIDPIEVNIKGTSILMLPWINSSNYEKCMRAIEKSNALIVCAHLELQGFEMYRGAVNDHGLSHKLFSKFDLVLTGHFHHKSKKDNIHYLGAPYEMTWSDYNDDRGFHLLDLDTKELTFVQNPYRIFNKVFYDDKTVPESKILEQDYSHIENSFVKVIVKNKENPYCFDVFIDRLNSFSPHHLQVVEDNFHLDVEDDNEILSEAEDTVTIIRKYIDNLGIEKPKQMEELFFNLYNDALSLD